MKTTKQSNTFTVFSQHLAGTLMRLGFVLVGMEAKRNDPKGRNVYFFNDSPELQEAIANYKAHKI